MNEKKKTNRTSICINLTKNQLKRFDFCKEVIEESFDYEFLLSRTDALAYLCNYYIKKEGLTEYFYCKEDDVVRADDELERQQLRFPF